MVTTLGYAVALAGILFDLGFGFGSWTAFGVVMLGIGSLNCTYMMRTKPSLEKGCEKHQASVKDRQIELIDLTVNPMITTLPKLDSGVDDDGLHNDRLTIERPLLCHCEVSGQDECSVTVSWSRLDARTVTDYIVFASLDGGRKRAVTPRLPVDQMSVVLQWSQLGSAHNIVFQVVAIDGKDYGAVSAPTCPVQPHAVHDDDSMPVYIPDATLEI